ncbi:MAG: hypothetical protein BWY83_01618 [bacterium ADurb.Bin478]|nr:MAG: hypothetical protein BWY83_01618 [bacterium ADurb.Bin478]
MRSLAIGATAAALLIIRKDNRQPAVLAHLQMVAAQLDLCDSMMLEDAMDIRIHAVADHIERQRPLPAESVERRKPRIELLRPGECIELLRPQPRALTLPLPQLPTVYLALMPEFDQPPPVVPIAVAGEQFIAYVLDSDGAVEIAKNAQRNLTTVERCD